MAKYTYTDLENIAKLYVNSEKQAAAWNKTADNIYGAIDKIGKQVLLDGNYEDKLPELDADDLPLGKTIEEMFLELTQAEDFTTAAAEGAKNNEPNFPEAGTTYYSYTLGRKKIKTSEPFNNIERAALTAEDSANMISKILERLNNSYSMFKYAVKKQLLGNAADMASTAGLVTTIAKPTDALSGEAFIKQIKTNTEDASFAHMGGLENHFIGATPSLMLYVKKGVIPSLQVDTFAGAFNREELAVPAKLKVLDDFGKMTDGKVYAILVDTRGVKLHRGYHVVRSAENADGDFINFVDHSEHTGFISKYVYIHVYKTA